MQSGQAGAWEETPEGRWIQQLGTTVPTQVKRRVQQSLNLARRCTSLEKEKASLEKTCTAQDKKLRIKVEELARARQQLTNSQQPHQYLVEAVQRAEDEAARASGLAKVRVTYETN